jgi:hypothetical protein
MTLHLRIAVTNPEDPFDASAPLYFGVKTMGTGESDLVAKEVHDFLQHAIKDMLEAKGWTVSLGAPPKATVTKLAFPNGAANRNGNGHA